MIEKEDFQWKWGVFCGFKKDKGLEDILKYPLPLIERHAALWENPVGIEHPLADIEIVAWHSVLTVFISKEECLVEKYKSYFIDSKDFEKYNEEDKYTYEMFYLDILIGHEIGIEYKKHEYFISHNEVQQSFYDCETKKIMYFDKKDLFSAKLFDGKTFKEAWSSIENFDIY